MQAIPRASLESSSITLLVVATAFTALLCLVALTVALPRTLAFPSAQKLQSLHAELQRETDWRKQVESELRQTLAELERRVQDRTSALKHSLEVGGRERDRVRHREEQLRRTVEASPSAFVMVDKDGIIQLVNSQTERSFGYDRGQLVGERVEVLVPDEVRTEHPAFIARYLRAPQPLSLQGGSRLRGRRKDGSEFSVEISLTPIKTPHGLQVLASIVDITERQITEETLERKRRELERSNRELAQFASVVSHDLKSPLRGIASLAEWVAADYGEVLGEEGRQQLELLRERTIRMHDLIEGILEYSRAGRGGEPRTRVCVSDVVDGVRDALAPPKNIEIRVESPLPDCKGIEVQVAQVFQNLIANAIQHLGKPTGTIMVSGRALPDGDVEYSVSDDGAGIAPEHHERVFRIFQTLKKPGGSKSTGIGLSIVQKLVESHGGMLSLESEVDQGTTFRFTMPGIQ